MCLISEVEPKTANEAYKDNLFIKSMNEEIEYIEKNKTSKLVPRPKYNNIVKTKCVFKNKMNEQG